MPPLQLGGRSFLISWDDLTFPAAGAVALHLVWIFVDTSREAEYIIERRRLHQGLLVADATLCTIVSLIDVAIAVLAAQGSIMEKRRHERLLKFLVPPRMLCSILLFSIYTYAAFWIWEQRLAEFRMVRERDLLGWGAVDHRPWVTVLFEVIMLLRLFVVIPGACFMCAVLIPREKHATIAKGNIQRVLTFMGVGNEVVAELIGVLMTVFGQGTSDLVVPSDLLFGLALVSSRQYQGSLHCDELLDDEDHWDTTDIEDDMNKRARTTSTPRMPPSAVRASMIAGVNQPPVLLSAEREKDVTALQEITHYVTYAIAIYGAGMEFFTSTTYRHSSIPSPSALRRRVCDALRCCSRRRRGGELGVVLGDCCGCNQDAFRRLLREHADRHGEKESELLWGTWENRGPLSAPPFAAVLDHARCTLVVAIRGTMDIKDCIADLRALPAFFDPLGMADDGASRDGPFDDEADFFAHSTVITCAKDCLDRLDEAGVLEEALAPGGRAHGWSVVITGHSLGAGLATVLALMLRGAGRDFSDRVRAVCFEPPGGLLSKQLSDLTGKLGFVSAVCANDWISRLSIRGVQDLRERILDELEACDRSKWQLTMLMFSRLARKSAVMPLPRYLCCCACLGKPLANMFLRWGGGPLRRRSVFGRPPARQGLSVLRKDAPPPPSASFALFNELWPPSRVIYFRPTALEWWCSGSYQLGREWVAEWIDPQDLHEIIVSTRSVELHFPNILRDAYFSAAAQLGVIETDELSKFPDSSDDDDSCSDETSSDVTSSRSLCARKD